MTDHSFFYVLFNVGLLLIQFETNFLTSTAALFTKSSNILFFNL